MMERSRQKKNAFCNNNKRSKEVIICKEGYSDEGASITSKEGGRTSGSVHVFLLVDMRYCCVLARMPGLARV